jgi:hypothetical protein
MMCFVPQLSFEIAAQFIARCKPIIDFYAPAPTRFSNLILKHSKQLLPLQRDLRGETPLEICALHGDHHSTELMLQYLQVREREREKK